MLLSSVALAQSTVKGTVLDETGQPLPGVNIISSLEQNKGTITDIDGAYTITLENPQADTLTFSFTGYQPQEVAVNNRSTIDVSLDVQDQIMDEVVVVGYGVQQKSDLTGAISSVGQEELTRVSSGNVEQILQGRVSGVQITPASGEPGRGAVVRIRGTGTLGDASPLYVVDGVLLNDIDFLNPNDIASIEVLKDASATAIYGSRGANGVIIVTTKQGSVGKPRFTVNTYYGTQEVVDPIDLTNANQFATLANEVAQNVGVAQPFDDPSEFGEGTDWQDVIFRNAPIQNHQISASGGNEFVRYNLSANYFDQEGIIRGSDFNRFTLRLNNQYTLSDNVEVGHNIAFTTTDRDNTPNVLTQAYRGEPVFDAFQEDGSFTNTTVRIPVGNPEATIFYNEGNNFTLEDRLVGNIYADVSFLKNFTFRSSFGLDRSMSEGKTFVPQFEVSPTSLQRNEESRLSVSRGERSSWLWENTVNYNRRWNIHKLDLLGGITAQETSFENLGGSRRNFLGESEEFFFLGAGETETQTNFNGGFEESILSYLFRVNYVLLDRYLFTASFRADGSSKFGENNRYGYFPSLALGWNLTNEPFLQDVPGLSRMKIRGSWGLIGNEKIGAYEGKPTVTSNINAVFGEPASLAPGASLVDPANPDIQWEETEQFNVGLELGVLDNRLTAEVDYYVRTTSEILVAVPIADYIGVDSDPVINAARVENSGVDLNLQWRDDIGDFSYGVGLVGSTVNNEVLGLGGGQEEIFGGPLGVGGLLGTRTTVGQPIGAFFGYRTNGIFQNEAELEAFPTRGPEEPGDLRFVDVNGDGTITSEDRTQIGNPIPDYNYGFNVTMSYKGIDLAVEFNGQQGNEVYNAKKQARFGTYNFETSFLDRWTGEGTSNTEPRVTNGGHNYEPSDRFIEDGSFTRLRTIQIGYSLPNSLLNRFGINKMRFYLNGNNLVTWTDYSGYTPEISSGSVIDVGIDRGVYPIAKTFTAGLDVTF